MQIFLDKGLWIQQATDLWGIDLQNGKKKADTALISHAHADHYAKGQSNALATPETLALIQNNKPNFKNCSVLAFEKKQKINETTTCFYNAGHVLGSAQIKLETPESTILVSGDFNPIDSILLKAAQPQQCDSLVIETTFGLPHYSFPEREKVHQEIGKWIKQNVQHKHFVVLAGYALGKGQELTKICNEYANEIPLVHDKIFATNKVYKKFGVKPGNYLKLEHNLKEANVLIMPPSLLDKSLVPALEYTLNQKVVTAMATGWGYRNGFDKVFPLSDHADFSRLLEFVKACNPKQVYTIHGFASEFAHAVQRKLRISARALGKKDQLALTEFNFA